MEEITVNEEVYVKKDIPANLNKMVVRSYAAGVFYGSVKEVIYTQAGVVVILMDSRRIHYWEGAASLSQLASEGVKSPEKCRFAMLIAGDHIVANVVEMIPVTAVALENLDNVKPWKM